MLGGGRLGRGVIEIQYTFERCWREGVSWVAPRNVEQRKAYLLAGLEVIGDGQP